MGRIKKYLSNLTELPMSAFGERPYIEFEVDNALKLVGCREILGYDDTEARFMTEVGIVTVLGEGLELCSYGNSTVRITGRIIEVTVGEAKKC